MAEGRIANMAARGAADLIASRPLGAADRRTRLVDVGRRQRRHRIWRRHRRSVCDPLPIVGGRGRVFLANADAADEGVDQFIAVRWWIALTRCRPAAGCRWLPRRVVGRSLRGVVAGVRRRGRGRLRVGLALSLALARLALQIVCVLLYLLVGQRPYFIGRNQSIKSIRVLGIGRKAQSMEASVISPLRHIFLLTLFDILIVDSIMSNPAFIALGFCIYSHLKQPLQFGG